MGSSDKLSIYGGANRFSSLLTKEPEVSATTTLRLKSKKLKWEDFMNIFANHNKGPKDKVKQPSYVLQGLNAKDLFKIQPFFCRGY